MPLRMWEWCGEHDLWLLGVPSALEGRDPAPRDPRREKPHYLTISNFLSGDAGAVTLARVRLVASIRSFRVIYRVFYYLKAAWSPCGEGGLLLLVILVFTEFGVAKLDSFLSTDATSFAVSAGDLLDRGLLTSGGRFLLKRGYIFKFKIIRVLESLNFKMKPLLIFLLLAHLQCLLKAKQAKDKEYKISI